MVFRIEYAFACCILFVVVCIVLQRRSLYLGFHVFLVQLADYTVIIKKKKKKKNPSAVPCCTLR
jgi:hypothetical protein